MRTMCGKTRYSKTAEALKTASKLNRALAALV